MGEKTNQEWIEDNNDKIDEITTKVNTLPDYSYIKDSMMITGTGENITLNKTAAELDYVIPPLPRGNTKQNTRSGKNKIKLRDSSDTLNDITAICNSTTGEAKINGTPSQTFNLLLGNVTLPTGTYTLSGCPSGGSWNDSFGLLLVAQGVSYADYGSTKTFTLEVETSFEVMLRVSSSYTFNNFVIKPQLELGSNATEFELYGVSPSPDYSSEVQVVKGNVEVDTSNRNLFDKNNYDGIFNGNFDNDILNQLDTRHVWIYIKCKGNLNLSNYVKGAELSQGIGRIICLDRIPANGVTILSKTNYPNYTKTTTHPDTKYVMIYLGATFDSSWTTQQDKINSLILEMTTEKINASDYVSHQGQRLPLTLGNIELCKIGDYQDYFYKDSSKWYWHERIGETVLDGSESNWERTGSSRLSYYNGTIVNNVKEIDANIIANYFIGKPYTNRYDDANTISANANTIVLTFEDDKFNSVNDFKTWLSTHNTKVKYILEEPIDIEITDTTLINQLEAINNAISYGGQTNIIGYSEELSPLFNVKAYKNTKAILEDLGWV